MSDAPKPTLVGFGLANYRSFDQQGFVIRDVRKINVFIGKNNSGKSNILRAIRLLRRITSPRMHQGEETGHHDSLGLKPEIDGYRQNGEPPHATAVLCLDNLLEGKRKYLDLVAVDRLLVSWNTANGGTKLVEELDEVDDRGLLRLHDHLTTSRYRGDPSRKQLLGDLSEMLTQRAVAALRQLDKLICIENFREIRSDSKAESGSEIFNGYDIIPQLRQMQTPNVGKDEERSVFDRIQDFVRGLLGEQSIQLSVPPDNDLLLVQMHGNKRLPLDSFGTGVHQLVILCAALAIHDDYVVCIEEPEIHMHPEMQRKFLQFIASETNNRYFITTHSNVFLDFLPDVAIYHVKHDGEKSTVTSIEATAHSRDVLSDLGYKASDLLQANCVIWVEGPSDRIYINRWLSLIASDLIEGIHYSMMFYGGSTLKHFAAVDDPTDDLVEVLRINRNAFFVMDRDAVKPTGKLNVTKERVCAEIGEEQCWVTKGREIENYLRPDLLKAYLSDKYNEPVYATYGRTHRVDAAILKATKDMDRPTDYAKAKVAYAREFCDRMTADDLDSLDLLERMKRLVAQIRRWNYLQPETDELEKGSG